MAHLPPKIPTNWPNFPSQRTPSMNSFFPPIQSSWVEDFPDFSSVKRSSHCRSASDSVTFLEAPEECGTFASKSTRDFDKIDGEQLMSMFSDDITGALPSVPLQRASPNSSENPSTPSYRDSINDLSTGAAADNNNDNIIYDSINTDNNNKDNKSVLRQTQLAGEAEVQSAFNSETRITTTTTTTTTIGNSTVSADSNIDPKRVKRILANRQSAQRSRVRKLQYISELERSVTSLQTEVSTLSPQVAFLDHQRLVLNVDNSTLKQRIAALAQDKLFKDAHQEALKQEIERLRQVYHQQNLHKITGTPREP